MDAEEEERIRKRMESLGAKQRAEFDQLGQQLVDLAPVLAKFHEALVEGGMSREEALELARSWLQMQLMKNK